MEREGGWGAKQQFGAVHATNVGGARQGLFLGRVHGGHVSLKYDRFLLVACIIHSLTHVGCCRHGVP